jgi:hypothetical protein
MRAAKGSEERRTYISETSRIAANIAKLPELVKCPQY